MIDAVKNMKLLFLIISMILFYACSERCESFPEKYKEYTPYEKGDIVSFENTKGKNITFEVTDMNVREGNERIPWNCKCVCESDLSYNMYSSLNNITLQITSNYTENKYWSISSKVYDSSDGRTFYGCGTAQLSDTLILSSSKKSNEIGTIKLVRGVGLVSLFIGDEEYTLIEGEQNE